MMPPSAAQRRPVPRRPFGEAGGLAERSFESLTSPAKAEVPAPGEAPRAIRVRPNPPPAAGPVEAPRPVAHVRPGPPPAAGPGEARPARPSIPASPRRRPRRRIEEGSRVSLSVEEVASVRPFVVTGGRTQASTDTHLESILEVASQQWLADKGKRLSSEEAAIVRQIATTYLTVAEVAAHLKLPVGVVKVLVSDLAEAGVLVVHDTMAGGGGGVDSVGSVSREQTLELLESVLNAISKL
ncbi:MAG: DUF742 domain-containing protein [Bifidobacteriaceae bacterium]|jgi:hypothetical protein|nr:DUF742 domain-containing protein [Bifidobacteriaceae bacterium]